MPIRPVCVSRCLTSGIGRGQRLVERIISVACNLIRSGSARISANTGRVLLINGEQIDIVRIISIAGHATDRVGRFCYVSDAIVFVLRSLRCSIVENAYDLAWASTRSHTIRVRLAGVAVPNAVFERSFFARRNSRDRAIHILSPMSGSGFGVVVHAIYRRIHLNGFLVPIEGVGEIET